MITLFTSGSTKEPKLVHHEDITQHVARSIKEIGLTKKIIAKKNHNTRPAAAEIVNTDTLPLPLLTAW